MSPNLTPRQRSMMRHALGLDNDVKQTYRNRYWLAWTTEPDHALWVNLVQQGLAGVIEPHPATIKTPKTDLTGFYLTLDGARAVLEPGETLDPEDFPT